MTTTTKQEAIVEELTELRDMSYEEAISDIIQHMGPHDCEVDYDGILIECFGTTGDGEWWLKSTIEELEQAEADYSEGGAKYDSHLAHLTDEEREERFAAAFYDGPTGTEVAEETDPAKQVMIGEYYKLTVRYYDEEQAFDGHRVREHRTHTREYVFPEYEYAMGKVAECKAKDGVEEVTMASPENIYTKFSIWVRHYVSFKLVKVTEYAVI